MFFSNCFHLFPRPGARAWWGVGRSYSKFPVDLGSRETYTQKESLSGRLAHFFVVMSMGVEWDRVRRLIQEVVEGQGYEFVDTEFKGAGKNSILRIFIDRPTGISHRDCELVSEQVGTVLDVEDLIPFSHTLEVSSPGLDRKLVTESDYTRFEGKLARIQTRIPRNPQKVFRGRRQGLHGRKVRL